MTDKELLELAAKASGLAMKMNGDGDRFADKQGNGYYGYWNPLTDDGDALRLAVKLGFMSSGVGFAAYLSELQNMFDADLRPSEATRRAIVSAAADIGKGMG